MKLDRILFLFLLIIFSLSALISCGGGGGSSSNTPETDFASITVEGTGTVLYTEAENTNAPSGYSPYLMSSSTGTTGTYLYSLDWNGSSWDTRFEIHTWGTGAGTFSIKNDNAMVIFVPSAGPTYSSVPNTSASGTIAITELGPPGGKVKGTFDVISLVVASSSVTGTAHLTGSFSVTRQ